MTDQARQVRDFWFGRAPLSAAALEQRMRFWFGGAAPQLREQRDAMIRARFGTLVASAGRGELAAWADSPRRRLSLIVLLDQFPRNIHRGTARAFEHDEYALALSLSGIQSAADAALDAIERIFFYMPLQHAESLEVQEESVAAYTRLVAEGAAPLHAQLASVLRYAQQHHAIVQRFGRFPHRNQILGRVSTAQERAWLQDNTHSFGQ